MPNVPARVHSFLRNNRVFRYITSHKRLTAVVFIIFLVLLFVFRPKPAEELPTEKVSKANITQSLSSTGSVTSQSAVDLRFLTTGKVVSVRVKKGDTVTAGQVIATLDSRTTQKNLENAMRDYAKQRNTFEETKADNQNPSTDEVKRLLENNQYDLEKAVTSVELQELAREAAVLTTPISGVVTRADITVPGVMAGATTTYSVADPENLIFQVEVDEADIGKVVLGQSIRILLDAYPDQTLYGVVEKIDFASHATETGGNAYYVEAGLPLNSSYTYRVGMSGDAEIIIAEKKNVLKISLASLIDEQHVYVKTGKKYEKRKVKLGIQSDTDVEVISGLTEGEEVSLQPDDVEEKQNPKPKT